MLNRLLLAGLLAAPAMRPRWAISRPFIDAVGTGSIASSTDALRVMLPVCKASAEEHMRRVVAQGDIRPFQDGTLKDLGDPKSQATSRALDDIRKILASRENLLVRALRRGGRYVGKNDQAIACGFGEGSTQEAARDLKKKRRRQAAHGALPPKRGI